MSRKKQAPEEPVEETEEQPAEEPAEEGSKAAGVVLLLVLGGAGGAALFTVAPGAGVLSLWGAGALLLFRAVARKQDRQPLPSPTESPPLKHEIPDGSTVTRPLPGWIVASRPDAVNPSRTHIKVIKTDSE